MVSLIIVLVAASNTQNSITSRQYYNIEPSRPKNTNLNSEGKAHVDYVNVNVTNESPREYFTLEGPNSEYVDAALSKSSDDKMKKNYASNNEVDEATM